MYRLVNAELIKRVKRLHQAEISLAVQLQINKFRLLRLSRQSNFLTLDPIFVVEGATNPR